MLKITNINENLINIFKEIHYRNSWRVKVENELSELWTFHHKWRLFVAVSKFFKNRKWTRKSHKLTDSKYIHHLLFTNDQVIIAEYEDITYIFHKLRDYLDEWWLKINMNETEHLTKSLKVDLLLDVIKTVQEIKCLGSIIHQDLVKKM